MEIVACIGARVRTTIRLSNRAVTNLNARLHTRVGVGARVRACTALLACHGSEEEATGGLIMQPCCTQEHCSQRSGASAPAIQRSVQTAARHAE